MHSPLVLPTLPLEGNTLTDNSLSSSITSMSISYSSFACHRANKLVPLCLLLPASAAVGVHGCAVPGGVGVFRVRSYDLKRVKLLVNTSFPRTALQDCARISSSRALQWARQCRTPVTTHNLWTVRCGPTMHSDKQQSYIMRAACCFHSGCLRHAAATPQS